MSVHNNPVHNTTIIASYATTNSNYATLLILNFFFLEIEVTATCPIAIVVPVWLFKSGCTENAALSYHLMILVLSADMVKTIYFVPFKHFISIVNFFALTSFWFFTLLHKISIVDCMHGIDIFHKNRPFSVILWNIYAFSLENILQLYFLNTF